MTSDVQEGPLEAAPELTAPAKKSWRDKRRERRRRRIWLEELLGWILVPVILVAGYFFIDIVLTALGTSLGAVLSGLETIWSSF